MKRLVCLLITATLLLFSAGCRKPHTPASPTNSTVSTTLTTTSTVSTTTATTATTAIPAHSPLFSEGISVDEVITYFNEVCLDAEFVNSGDATRLQKWYAPLRYSLRGTPTDEDLEVLTDFIAYLNTIDGFPGISQADEQDYGNMQIRFCSQDEMIDILGEQFHGMDGGVTFWYDNDNRIYRAEICVRNDLDQYLRNSVILEELYNSLGPVQDTDLRTDSIIYSGFSTPQTLTATDKLLLQLLYHPQMDFGINADACETIIRQLYY